MRALWLPEVLRAAGLVVHEYPGWRTRGSESWGPVVGVVTHATAGRLSVEDDCRVLWVTGSVTAPAPISQVYLARSGEWTVGASGRCNHVKLSDVRPDSRLGVVGNSQLIGVEAGNDNRGEPWPAVQLDSYQRGVAAILGHLDLGAGKVAAHREHQTGKTDPFGIDMTAFRAGVAHYLEGADVITDADVERIAKRTKEMILSDGGMQQLFTRTEAIVSARDPVPIGEGQPNELAKLVRQAAGDGTHTHELGPAVPAEDP